MDLNDDFDVYDGNDAITCIVEGAACFAYWEWWWIKVERKTEREDENVNLAYLRFLLDFGSTWRVLRKCWTIMFESSVSNIHVLTDKRAKA